jgi:hypothetical protein
MSMYLGWSAQVEEVSGQYFAVGKPTESSKSSYDTAATGRLWQVSAELVGLSTRPRN